MKIHANSQRILANLAYNWPYHSPEIFVLNANKHSMGRIDKLSCLPPLKTVMRVAQSPLQIRLHNHGDTNNNSMPVDQLCKLDMVLSHDS